MTDRKLPKAIASAPDEDMNQYLREIRAFPLLSEEEERALALRSAQGDQEAIKAMVNSNLRLVVSVARAYTGRGVPLMDLIQEGSIGLLVAARKFDYKRDCRFSTYAVKWIRQGITRCIVNHAGPIRVPAYTAEKMQKLLTARAALLQQTGEEPEPEDLAKQCGMTPQKVRQLLALVPEVCSLDLPVGDQEEGTLGALIADLRAPEPQQELVRRELEHTMQTLMGLLSDRQQTVIRLHFGMDDGQCRSLEQIGRHMGISKERARQIERQAMNKLQKMGVKLGLEDYCSD